MARAVRQGDGIEVARVQVTLLGAFGIRVGELRAGPWYRPPAKHLCELVMLSPGRKLGREMLRETLFPSTSPASTAQALSKALSLARRALLSLGEPGSGMLESDRAHIWVPEEMPIDIDLLTHERALRSALSMEPGSRREAALSLALLQDGTLLEGELYQDWAIRPRESLELLRQRGRLELARDRAGGWGRSHMDAVIEAWENCFAHDPTCEEAAVALIRIYSGQGRSALAHSCYSRCRTALEELGLTLSPALADTYAGAVAVCSPAELAPNFDGAKEELRIVSILSAQLTVPFGGRFDPEELKEVVTRALAKLISHIEQFGGTVTSVTASGLEAVFGAPISHEDDPERALRAAYRIQSSQDGATEIAVRVGVETGQALLGAVGGGRYGAVGEVVAATNLLASSAKPCSVLVGPDTYGAADGLFEWGPTEELERPGHAKPIAARYLERPRARAWPLGRNRLTWAPPVVGRDAELLALDEVLRATVAGNGRVVFMVGEAGLGKTRLVHECRKRFMAWVGAGSARLPLWLEGRGASYTSAVPYGLYQQLFFSWVGVPPEEGRDLARPALDRAMRAVFGTRCETKLALAYMMGMATAAETSALSLMAPRELQLAISREVRAVICRLLAKGPTVLVLEDLHWADPTSLRLTEELAGLTTDAPLLVLGTRRPEPDPGVLALEASLSANPRLESRKLELFPLAADAERALARSLLGEGPPDSVIEDIRTSADGNPLFLEERLSSLLETGALVKDVNGWQLERGLAKAVPEALERLVRARIDRLGAKAREVIVAASVLGAEFTLPELRAVWSSDADLSGPLTELCSGGLLREVTETARPSYRFRHALIQEATYAALPKRQCRHLHVKAAQTIEQESADRLEEVAGVLGHHYAAADEPNRAVHFLELGGDRAASVFANKEAIELYRSALTIIGKQGLGAAFSASTGAPLRAKLGEVLWRCGHNAAAWEVLQEAVRVEGPEDGLQTARLHYLLGKVETSEGRMAAALANFEKGKKFLGQRTEDQATADLRVDLLLEGEATVYFHLDQPERAKALLDEALPIVQARGSPMQRQAFYNAQVFSRLVESRYRAGAEVLANARRAVAAAKEGCGEHEIGWRLFVLGLCLLLVGDLRKAKETLTSALNIAERIDDSELQATCAGYLLVCALRSHEPRVVASLAHQAIKGTVYSNEYAGIAKASLAWLAWREGRFEEVEFLAKEALLFLTPKSVQQSRWPARARRFQWVCLWPLVGARLALGHTAEAVEASRRLLLPPQIRLPDDLERAVKTAQAAWDRGEHHLAKAELLQAVALAEDLVYL